MVSKGNSGVDENILQIFGLSESEIIVVAEDVEPPKDFLMLKTENGISSEEVISLAGPYGEAAIERLRRAAFIFNKHLAVSGVTLPWRDLLNNLQQETAKESSLQSIALPDGSKHLAVVDRIDSRGGLDLLEALISLREALEEVENYRPDRHINPTLRSGVMSQIRREANPENHRGAAYPREEIAAEARRLDYWNAAHGKRKEIRDQIIKNLNLRAINKATAKDSMHRTIERILNKNKPDI